MAKKRIRQTNLIHLAEMLQVSKLIKRENRTDFEKGIQEPLLTGLAIFVNRYMFYGDFRRIGTAVDHRTEAEALSIKGFGKVSNMTPTYQR